MNGQGERAACKGRKVVLPLLFFFVFLFFPIVEAAGSPSVTPVLDKRESREVYVQDKATGANFIFVKERPFRVAPEAVIKDKKGKPLTFENLAVPCRARITYHLSGHNRRPYVTEITCLD